MTYVGAVVVGKALGCCDGAALRVELVGDNVGTRVGDGEGTDEGKREGSGVGEAVGVLSTHCTMKDVPPTAPGTHAPFAEGKDD